MSQKQAIHVMLKCANNCSEWLVPPVWCHPTDERLLAAVRMYAVLSVNASQRRAIDSLPGGKHTISGREQTYWISTSSPSSASTLRWWVFRSHSPFPFYFSSNASFFWGGFTVFLSLTRRWQRNQFGELLKNPNTAAILEQDLLRLDMNSAEQTVTWLITLGVLESPKKTISDPEAFLQSSLKDGVVLCRLLERLSPGTTEKVRTLKHPPPPPSLLTQRLQPTARPVGASVRCRSVKTDAVCCLASLSANWSMRRFSFVGHGSPGYCLRKLRYMLTQTCPSRVCFQCASICSK